MAPADKKGTGLSKAGDPAAEAKKEAELTESLKRLEDAHDQLNEIKSALDRMLQPLHSPATDPELVYAAFAHSAQKAVREVKEFKMAMRDEKMQELMKRRKEWIKPEYGNGWLGGLNGAFNEDTSAALNGVDALKIESSDTPKKS